MIWVLRHEKRRIVPFTFERASEGDPAGTIPPVDDRGSRHPTFGPIFPMSATQQPAFVRIVSHLPGRHRIGLTTTSTAFRILDAPPEKDIEGDTLVQIGPLFVGGASTDGVLEVRAGGISGPVVGKLTIRVFSDHFVIPAIHPVQLFNAHGDGPVADTSQLGAGFEIARQVWEPYGIRILDPVRSLPVVRVRSADVNSFHLPANLPSAAVNQVLTSVNMPGFLNVFVINQLQMGTMRINGMGISHTWVASHVAARRGLLLAANGDPSGQNATIAHELGHILDAAHVGGRNAPHIDGTSFALRQLMHNFGPPLTPDPWPKPVTSRSTTRPRFLDVGWGERRVGGLVTLKTIQHVPHDNQANTVTNSLRQHPL